MGTITSDEELIIALTEMAGPLYKLTVNVRKAVQETAGAAGGDDAEIVHHGVTCDGCNMHPITGPRYKCLVRDDYDLCGRCEAAGLHLGNNMMKITTPGNVFPHRLFKRIQRLKKKDDEKKKDEKHEKTHEEAVKAAQEASKEAHEQAHSAAQAAAASAAFSFPTMTGPEDYLQNVGSFVAAALDPLGIDVKIDIETPEGRKSCHVSRQTSSASAEASAEASSGQENEEAKKEDEVANTEEKKVEPEPAKEANTPSDDEEEWTVLNDKKEADGQGASLYPKLTENPPAEIPSAPVASHPDPKIQVALQAMMNMGFSNEGGWLSSLLEAKNGDIGKVLDILQPIKK